MKPLRIQATLGDQRIDEDLELLAQIDNNLPGLNAALAQHPGRFALWAMLEAQARAQVETLAQDIAHAEIETMAQVQAEHPGERPLPDAKARAVVRRAAAYQTQARRLLQAKHTLRQIQVGRKTLEQKKEMILSLAANLRLEFLKPAGLRQDVDFAKERLKDFYQAGPPLTPHPKRSTHG